MNKNHARGAGAKGQKSESAKNLFCLIGFMPDGVTSNDLCLIVGDGSKVEEDLQLLINA